MKQKLIILLLSTAILFIAIAPSVKAFARLGIYGFVNKIQYDYGETGTLEIWVINEGTDPLILHNITIYYPWNAILPWEGEDIIEDIDEVIPVEGNKTYTREFTIPDNIGIISTFPEIEVIVVTDKITRSSSISMNVVNAPLIMDSHNLNNLVTLISVQIIIQIVAAIIIAAAIFLSKRQALTWQKET